MKRLQATSFPLWSFFTSHSIYVFHYYQTVLQHCCCPKVLGYCYKKRVLKYSPVLRLRLVVDTCQLIKCWTLVCLLYSTSLYIKPSCTFLRLLSFHLTVLPSQKKNVFFFHYKSRQYYKVGFQHYITINTYNKSTPYLPLKKKISTSGWIWTSYHLYHSQVLCRVAISEAAQDR